MDDTLSGGHSFKEAVKEQQQLIKLCKVGDFSFHNEALFVFPSDICSQKDSLHSYFDLLGLHWSVKWTLFFF